jgi:hypothetical protein
MDANVDKPSLNLSTRCKGGADPPYTKSLSVFTWKKKTERFRIV